MSLFSHCNKLTAWAAKVMSFSQFVRCESFNLLVLLDAAMAKINLLIAYFINDNNLAPAFVYCQTNGHICNYTWLRLAKFICHHGYSPVSVALPSPNRCFSWLYCLVFDFTSIIRDYLTLRLIHCPLILYFKQTANSKWVSQVNSFRNNNSFVR